MENAMRIYGENNFQKVGWFQRPPGENKVWAGPWRLWPKVRTCTVPNIRRQTSLVGIVSHNREERKMIESLVSGVDFRSPWFQGEISCKWVETKGF